ncbi:AbrB family transcriptional regulator [Faunimonas sp. B44]|uniref:AbrB family transcriptional regulator n=1 Tax=Faunimonas sp. B44 TaxID=3461493 RepID=UPI004044CBD1
MKRLAQGILTWVAAILAGYAGNRAGIPLAWVLGPLVVTAVVAMSGLNAFAPLAGRRFGQVIIGAAIGLNMTAAAVGKLALWLPVMVATGLVSMLIGAAISVPLARLARIDGKTAFFAMVPGGLSEMANVGASVGARSDAIALSQALRVALAVCLMPPLVLALGHDGGIASVADAASLDWPTVAGLLLTGLVGVQLMRMTPLNNPWMLGSLAASAILAGTAVVEGHMPSGALWLGQFLIGIAIGARFKRDIVNKLLRLTFASSAMTILFGGLLLLLALLISTLSDLDIASAALGASPGGFAEMAVTAQALHLDVALVAGFHFVRAVLVNSLATHYWTTLDRIGFFRALRRALDL